MAKGERPLLDLLEPIFQHHADKIEALLPPDLRSRWRKAVAFRERAGGPKPLDHRDLLLAMAEIDTEPSREPRELAKEVIDRFPSIAGAGSDDRPHVELRDGTRPAREDLLKRLTRAYSAQRQQLREEVETGRTLALRAEERAERVRRDGLPSLRARPEQAARTMRTLYALARQGFTPGVTAYQCDQVGKAIRRRCGGIEGVAVAEPALRRDPDHRRQGD